MKLKSTADSPHGYPIFTRVFPFKLKYLGFSCKNEEPTIRRFSTRPFRSKASSSGRSYNQNSDFSRGRGGTNPSKSLIEDEAELSDWVSELKSDSVRTRFPSDDDDSDSSNFNRDRSKFKSRDRGMNRETRESFGSMRNQRGGRNGFSSLKRGRDSDSFNSEPFSRSSRGRGSAVVGKRQFGNNFDEKHDRFSMQGRRRVDEDLDEGYGFSRQKRGSRSGSSLTRGGRHSGLSYERNRGSESLMGGGKSMGRRVPLGTDDESEGDEEEEEESKMPTIKDLLSDEGSDEGEDEVEEEEDDDDDKNDVSSMFKFKSIKEDGAGVSPRSLPGKSDSYLSETRYIFEILDQIYVVSLVCSIMPSIERATRCLICTIYFFLSISLACA